MFLFNSFQSSKYASASSKFLRDGFASPFAYKARRGPAPSWGAQVAGSWATSFSGEDAWVWPGKAEAAVRYWTRDRSSSGGRASEPPGGGSPSSERPPPRLRPLHRPRGPCPLSSQGGAAPWMPHGREGRGCMYPQVRLLNRVWR